jgi:hypothetical protein
LRLAIAAVIRGSPGPGSKRVCAKARSAFCAAASASETHPATAMSRARAECMDGGSFITEILPNVKDEPRRELARRVRRDDLESAVSIQSSQGSTRRDRSRRWLWRLVSPGALSRKPRP